MWYCHCFRFNVYFFLFSFFFFYISLRSNCILYLGFVSFSFWSFLYCFILFVYSLTFIFGRFFLNFFPHFFYVDFHSNRFWSQHFIFISFSFVVLLVELDLNERFLHDFCWIVILWLFCVVFKSNEEKIMFAIINFTTPNTLIMKWYYSTEQKQKQKEIQQLNKKNFISCKIKYEMVDYILLFFFFVFFLKKEDFSPFTMRCENVGGIPFTMLLN